MEQLGNCCCDLEQYIVLAFGFQHILIAQLELRFDEIQPKESRFVLEKSSYAHWAAGSSLKISLLWLEHFNDLKINRILFYEPSKLAKV